MQLAELAQQIHQWMESRVVVLVQASSLEHHPGVLHILDISDFVHYDVTKRKLLLLVSCLRSSFLC